MDYNIQKAIDEASRYNIKNNIDENYFVQAGAGSGKTTALVERMVTMIEKGRDISHISAITFTKTAANEFYERFQKKLIEKANEKNNLHHDKYLKALQNIDLAFMGTIDSFCNTIMSEHPNEGLIPSNSSIIDDDKAQELYKKIYNDILNDVYDDKQLQNKGQLFVDYNSNPEEVFSLTLNSLLSHRDCELIIPKPSKDNIDIKYQDEIKTIRKIVKIICDNPNFIKANDQAKESVIQSFERNRYIFNKSWEDNIPAILNAYEYTFKSFYKKDEKSTPKAKLYCDDTVKNILAEGIDYFIEEGKREIAYILNNDKLPKIIKEIKDKQYAITLDFVNEAKDKILEVLRAQGHLTFNDYLVYLRDTLRKDAAEGGKLIRHIYERHRYYLIDEFQDTDPIQAEIFFYLAAEQIKDNWKDCIPHPGSLFIVGDPKQSIYRFKNADVAAYINVEKMFVQPVGEVLYLYQNFRSTYQLKDWFNNTFTQLLTDSGDQAKYENIPIDEAEINQGFTGVFKYDVPAKPQSDNQKDEYKVKDLILKLYQNPDIKYQLSEKVRNNAGGLSYISRKIDWKDIMVITPTKGSLIKYTTLFKECGIPYYVEGNIDFKQSAAFKIFVLFFAAVVNPDDNRYLYGILKSHLFNISQKDLIQAKKEGYRFNVLTDITNLKISEKLKKALLLLKEYVNYAKTYSSSSLFTKIINNVVAFKKVGNENMEYVYFALELLKSKENSGEVITHIDALHFFEKLMKEKGDQERCPGLQKEGNKVHLANLHKVKGLEAPIVIMATSKKTKKEADFRLERGNLTNKGYLFHVNKQYENGISKKIIETNLYDSPYKEDEQLSNEAENLRLQYVAATRAKNVLIIANKIKNDKTPSSDNPWKEILNTEAAKSLTDIDLVLNGCQYIADCSKAVIDYDDIPQAENIIEKNNDSLMNNDFELYNPSKTINNDEFEMAEIDMKVQKHLYENNGDTLATISGTMVHRLMEMLIMSKDTLNKSQLVDFILNENMTIDFEEYQDSFKRMLESVYDTIHNGGYPQINGAKQNILQIIMNADKVYSEVPFTYLDDDKKLWNGIIDLIYEKDGKLHIIDWKTNKIAEGLSKHYENQLNAYKQATKQIIGKDVEDALIYHISI